MDLYAYRQMEEKIDQDKLADFFGIYRLRGIRFMGEEEKIPEKDIQECITRTGFTWCENVLEDMNPKTGKDVWGWNGDERRRRRYFKYQHRHEKDESGEYDYDEIVAIRWENIHGKARKKAKQLLKEARKSVTANLELFNKFAGNKNVLMIHTRTGGGNRDYYKMHQLPFRQPRWLGDADDYFDDTYADIYFDISGLDMEQFMIEDKAGEETPNE